MCAEVGSQSDNICILASLGTSTSARTCAKGAKVENALRPPPKRQDWERQAADRPYSANHLPDRRPPDKSRRLADTTAIPPYIRQRPPPSTNPVRHPTKPEA